MNNDMLKGAYVLGSFVEFTAFVNKIVEHRDPKTCRPAELRFHRVAVADDGFPGFFGFGRREAQVAHDVQEARIDIFFTRFIE